MTDYNRQAAGLGDGGGASQEGGAPAPAADWPKESVQSEGAIESPEHGEVAPGQKAEQTETPQSEK